MLQNLRLTHVIPESCFMWNWALILILLILDIQQPKYLSLDSSIDIYMKSYKNTDEWVIILFQYLLFK
jgi:hypothetical protein